MLFTALARADNPLRKTLRYGGDASFIPFEWLDADGNPDGFQVELIRAVADAVQCELTIQLDTWSRTFARLEAGELDVVAMYDQPSRRQLVDFSQAFEIGAGEIFVRTDGVRIQSLEQLQDKPVIVQDRALAMQELPKRGIQPRFVTVSSESEAILLLASGQHDFAIVTSQGGRHAMKRFHLTNVTTTFEPILVSSICFAVRKGDAEALVLLNRGLDQLRADGTFNQIHDRWFSEPERPVVPVRRVIQLALWVGLPLLALLIVALFWNRALRYRVAVRTRELRAELANRRSAEAALRESEERLRVAIGASHITVAHQDRDLRYTWLNNSPNDYETQTFLRATDAQLFSPEAAAQLTTVKQRVLDSGCGEEIELALRGGDNPLWMRVVIEPLRDANAVIIGVTSVMIDITALKRSEQQNINLERRIRQAQKLESLGLLAGGVAHDFSNLLTGVAGNTALALQDAPQGTPLRERIESIEQIARRAKDLTQELLSLAGRRGGDVQRVYLGELVRDAVELFRASRQTSATVQFHADSGLAPIDANPTGLRQTVVNLLHNAVDAGAGRQVEIRVRVGQQDYSKSTLQQAQVNGEAAAGAYQFVEVTDNGAGMSPTDIPRIFDPFFTTKPHGRGFGLAIVAGTIMRHRGAVIVESNLGVGTIIRLLLPTFAATTGEPPPNGGSLRLEAAPSPPVGSTGAGEILVVDDNDVVREMMLLGLRRAGYVVHVAATPEAAIEIFSRTSRLSGAVVDVNLERGSGFEVLGQLRQANPSLAVIIVTGGDDIEVRRRLAGDPRALFLQKPFTLQELVAALRKLLGQTSGALPSTL
ncbi:MAG: transporter substrate-binding domain-containing protein [Phycisphaerales bacterium]|nr:transporter substrate-binding domain-containing protein [Phycisphaerales bacterium]